jgi:hypothetical protein
MAAGSGQMTPGRIASPSAVSPQTHDGRLRFMTRFIRIAALYNASGVLVLLTPGVLKLLGVDVPAPFWVWLGGLMGLFAGVVLFLSAADLTRLGAFPYWNGLIRFEQFQPGVGAAGVGPRFVRAYHVRNLEGEEEVVSFSRDPRIAPCRIRRRRTYGDQRRVIERGLEPETPGPDEKEERDRFVLDSCVAR